MDTSHIDIKAVIDQLCSIRWQKESRVKGAVQIKGGPCPLCGEGTDRFIIWPYGDASNPTPRFYCGIHGNGCKAHGDVITFVQLLNGYRTAYEAIRDLQEMGFAIGEGETPRPYTRREKQEGAPPQKWQDTGKTFVQYAESCLRSKTGQSALNYLHKRGLTGEMIQRFHIGYCPKWKEWTFADWGLPDEDGKTTFWIPQGIVIPTFEGDTLWRINSRLSPNCIARQAAKGKEVSRYMQVKGSQNSLFNVDAIQPGQPVFMTEGEFDAIIGMQQTGFIFVATGGTNGALMARWVARLSLASHIILAFDNDEGKGETSAASWVNIFKEKALLWLPTAKKDLTDMWLQGQDVKLWAETALKLVSSVPAKVEETPTPPTVEQEPVHEVCCMCLDEDKGTIAHLAGPDDFMFCEQHYRTLPDEWHKAETERLAHAYRDKLPGWKVEVLSPGEWEAHKAKQREARPESIEKPQRDFWADLEAKRAHRDLKKPVDWTKYGYRRGKDGRWHAPNSDYWTDNGYERDSRGHWYLPGSKVSI